jgi:hypothetical protein
MMPESKRIRERFEVDDHQSVGSWRELGSHFGTAMVLAGVYSSEP